MKAIVRDRHGSSDQLRLEEVDKPAPADDEVLVRVHAASVDAADWHVMRGDPRVARLVMPAAFGRSGPKRRIRGRDFAGRVEAVGRRVGGFQPGDEVFGAEVTAVCSRRNVDLLRSLGADHVVDYAEEDFAATGQRHDVVFDLVANRSPADLRRALTPDGTLVLSGGGVSDGGSLVGPMGQSVRAALTSRFVRQRFLALSTKTSRTYPLAEAPAAGRYLELEHARAEVVTTVVPPD
ncbi:NAD(P)-dependent alcohol dehydrogenase [Saccharothrix sp. 6-C]|uniref:NAD(P)-dependent alcohol dehydrogenase n=1 Tax=Saccharothrix sp. 6-C TaxID=2781735 RepID=UPI001917187B|nr:NAD(P)-dependent alcohol dehydrogenase [Saccharothrix sp. 6-C]QQQ78762.1 NAD(P)-dependent alcohol dehydrogenase [Saccharothrix sp. 6-C]